jgi:hypothetical protein
MVWRLLFEPDLLNPRSPVLRRKRSAYDIEDLPGLWRVHWQFGKTTLLSTFYTRIDQACLLWGIISAIIFISAQFVPIDWQTQAVIWSGLTLLGIVAMVELARYWRDVEPLSQVIDAWVGLMLIGLALTDLSICLSWGWLMAQLCALWLGLDALGYFYTGVKMRSRAFAVVGLFHLLGIVILPYAGGWQFLTTGLLTGISALLLAELQWDAGDVCQHVKAMQGEPTDL